MMLNKLRKALANCHEASYEGDSNKELEVIANELYLHLRLIKDSWDKGDIPRFTDRLDKLLAGES